MKKNNKNERFTERSIARRAVQHVRGLSSVLAVKKWANLSFAELGEEIAVRENRTSRDGRSIRPYSKSAASNWCQRKDSRYYQPMTRTQRDALADLLTEELRRQVADTEFARVLVSYTRNSPLRCAVYIRCETCGDRAPLDLRRREWRRCAKCAREKGENK